MNKLNVLQLVKEQKQKEQRRHQASLAQITKNGLSLPLG
jgi:hypothetical protein